MDVLGLLAMSTSPPSNSSPPPDEPNAPGAPVSDSAAASARPAASADSAGAVGSGLNPRSRSWDLGRAARELRTYFSRVGDFSRNAKLYMIGTFLMGVGHGSAWVHLNLYYRGLGLGEETIGRILSTGSLGTVLMAIPAALLIDRVPAKRVFAFASTGYAVSLGGQLLTADPTVLRLLAMTAGMSFTVHWATAAPFFMRNSSGQERIYLFGFAHAIETVATIVAAVGVGTVVGRLSASFSEVAAYRFALAGVAFLSLCAVAAFVLIDSRPPARSGRGFREYLVARDWKLLGKIIFPSATIGMGAGLIIPFLNLYFKERFGQSPLQIGGVYAVSQFFMVLGFLLGPVVARRLGIVRTVAATELASIPFFLLMAFTGSLPVAVVAFWMRGALMNMNHPLITNFAMEVVSEDQQAVTNSLRMLAWNLSWMVSTQVGGWLIEREGFTLPMLITIVLYATASITTYWFFRDRVSIGRADAEATPS